MTCSQLRPFLILLCFSHLILGLLAQELICPPLNICFAIDESSSIDASEFATFTSAVKQIAAELDSRAPGSSFAAVGWAANSDGTPRLDTIIALTGDRTAFNTAIDANPQSNGNTASGYGLTRCESLIENAAEPRVIALLTDGRDNRDPRGTAVAPGIKAKGISIATIGIGSTVSTTDLESIATAPEFNTLVDNFDDLIDKIAEIVDSFCLVVEPTPTPSMSATPSPSMSSTPSVSMTPPPSMSATASPSMSGTPSASMTPTPSVTPTPSATPSPKVIRCPCVCRRRGKHQAAKECAQPNISRKCKVLSCSYRGYFQCCDQKPAPTPSVTPSPKVIPCPCVCRRKGKHQAAKECAQPYISSKCKVLSCLYRGHFQCCDHKPTPSPKPTPSTKPKCPCYCTKLIIAVKQCKSLPHCQWSECRKHGFSCCDKH